MIISNRQPNLSKTHHQIILLISEPQKSLKIPELKTTKNPPAVLGFEAVGSYKNESDKKISVKKIECLACSNKKKLRCRQCRSCWMRVPYLSKFIANSRHGSVKLIGFNLFQLVLFLSGTKLWLETAHIHRQFIPTWCSTTISVSSLEISDLIENDVHFTLASNLKASEASENLHGTRNSEPENCQLV